MIEKHAHGRQRVLDLCCGNGGDIFKFANARCAQYIGVDISQGACERAQSRLQDTTMAGDVIVADAFGNETLEIVKALKAFDVVNCQFALHYSFDSEERAKTALQIISSALRNGGTLIGTVADGDTLDARRRKLGKKFGDRYFRVNFTNRIESEYGDAYAFTFNGSVDGLTEYVTRRETFQRLAADAGLTLVHWENMAPFAGRAMNENRELCARMDCTEVVDVTNLYNVFVFERAQQ